jgi:hypothetical protein
MEQTIDGKRNRETNVAKRTEASGTIEGDIVKKTAMPNTGEGQDHARETETGDI